MESPNNPSVGGRRNTLPVEPNPTTLVQADSCSFKQVVQMLTGLASGPGPGKERSASKLYERRSGASLKRFKMRGVGSGYSPSILDFPSVALSPVTPLIPDPLAEDWAIREKGFYLHPSPPTDSEPRLLPLFPVTSPRVAYS